MNSNRKLFNQQVKMADAFGMAASNGQFPVNLKRIAERRRVTSVEFIEMPVRAMLTTHSEGFRIFLKVNDSGEGDRYRESYVMETNAMLIPPKLRFSLAHELAHTLFYELRNAHELPKESFQIEATQEYTSLEILERYCNRLAGHLLMPSPLFGEELKRLPSLKPMQVIAFAENVVGASVSSMVVRIGDENAAMVFHDLRGCIAIVEWKDGDFYIGSIARPRSLNLAQEIVTMKPGEKLQIPTIDGSPLLNPRLSVEEKEVILTQHFQSGSKKVVHTLNYARLLSKNPSFLMHIVAKD